MKVYNLFLTVVFSLLVSCSSVNIDDPKSIMDNWRNINNSEIKQSLIDLENRNYDVKSDKNEPSYDYDALNISKLLATPPPPPIGNGELISFSITEEVPLKDVLIELGRLAEIDIHIDPKINTGIILKITEKPINVVIDKICELANLKYEYTDGILRIERDLPYTKNYQIDILAEHQLWTDLETSIQYLLEIFPVKQQEEATNAIGGNVSIVQTPTVIVNDNSNSSMQQKVSINKAANIISVYANSKAQKAIAAYIEQAKKNYSTQVLIEAKVVEVKLNDEYKAGINWTVTEDTGKIKTDPETGESEPIMNTLLSIIGAGGSTSGLVSGTIDKAFGSNKNLNVVIDAMQTFGDTKTLSSPRISTLNNQKATLDFINTIVYFSIEKEEEEDSDNGKTTTEYTSTKQEEEVGVKLEITPTIDLKNNEVILNVKPELSSLVGYVEDPVTPGNKVPQIQKRTLETSLRIGSGDIMVIGGLMSENISNSSNGVPFLMDIPIFGNLFKSRSDTKELVETVIFIKATIVDRDNSLNRRDRKIYKEFVE